MRWTHACLTTIAFAIVMLASRPASASCEDGLSEGFSECTSHPNCLCESVTKTCSNGGWYTLYSVDLNQCTGASPTPTSPTPIAPKPTPERPPLKPKSPCDRMKEWLQDQKNVLRAYEDDKLLGRAIRQHWNPSQYDQAVWRQAHGGAPIPPNGVMLMATNKDCEVVHYDEGCKTLIDLGLPREACQIALAHEEVHQRQCQNRPPNYDSKNLRQRRDREVEAYKQSISEIEKYISKNCGPGPVS